VASPSYAASQPDRPQLAESSLSHAFANGHQGSSRLPFGKILSLITRMMGSGKRDSEARIHVLPQTAGT
jgi:hypothetical protein